MELVTPISSAAVETALPVQVLALDDSEDDLFILKRLLRCAECLEVNLTTSLSLESGIEHLEANSFDIVLVDFHLGAHKGTEVIEQLRARGWQGPVIMITGQGAESVALAALRSGAADYLRKDALTPPALGRAIRNAVEKSRLRLALEEKNRELERTIHSLRHRQREIQSFYHTLSHELKTPLTATGEFISLVLEGFAGELTEKQTDYLSVAYRNCEGMSRSLDDILDASRLETGKLSIHRAPGSLKTTLERVRACYEVHARSKNLEFTLTTDVEPDTALIDEERIFQIVSNLVSNAFKFTSSGGTVGVALRKGAQGMLLVSVEDSGRGIDAGDLESVFERSYQTREEDSAVHGGLGIGLYICRQLARLHDGDITVTSEVGSGSHFVLSLPEYDPE